MDTKLLQCHSVLKLRWSPLIRCRTVATLFCAVICACDKTNSIPSIPVPRDADGRYQAVSVFLDGKDAKSELEFEPKQRARVEVRFRRLIRWKGLTDNDAVIQIEALARGNTGTVTVAYDFLDFVKNEAGVLVFRGEFQTAANPGHYTLRVSELDVPEVDTAMLFESSIRTAKTPGTP